MLADQTRFCFSVVEKIVDVGFDVAHAGATHRKGDLFVTYRADATVPVVLVATRFVDFELLRNIKIYLSLKFPITTPDQRS